MASSMNGSVARAGLNVAAGVLANKAASATGWEIIALCVGSAILALTSLAWSRWSRGSTRQSVSTYKTTEGA